MAMLKPGAVSSGVKLSSMILLVCDDAINRDEGIVKKQKKGPVFPPTPIPNLFSEIRSRAERGDGP